MGVRRKMLFIGVTWGLLSGGYQAATPSNITPLAWPYLIGQQVFYLLGIPAVSPMYFYSLGVAIWSLLFFALGIMLERLWPFKAKQSKASKQRTRGH